MENYADHFTAHLRIALLRLLAGQPGYKANSSLLCDGADAVGLSVSRDRVKTELAWLAEQRLVSVTQLDLGGLMIAKLEERGLEVVHGRVQVPGVKAPSP